jgi:hypothetical protein
VERVETIAEFLAQSRNKGGHCVESPDFAVEGHPRSANTFLVTALNMSWPDMAVQSHSHDSRNLTAADGSFPVVSVVRAPLDAIASYAVHLSLKDPDKAKNLTRLLGMYGDITYRANNNPNVLAIPFKQVVSDIVGTLDMLEVKYGLMGRVYVSSESIVNQTAELSRLVNFTEEEFAKKGHIPRDKDPLYAEILKKLQSPIHAESLANVTNLYDSIVTRYYEETLK